MSEMTVDEALEAAREMEGYAARSILWHDGAPDAAMTLAAEVRRLRAAVEAVRAVREPLAALPGLVYRDDVLAALEVSE